MHGRCLPQCDAVSPFPPFWRRGTVASRCGDAVLPHLRVVQSFPLCESGSAASAAAAVFCLLLSPLGAASPALGWCDRDDEQQQGLRLWGIKVRSKRNNLQSDRADLLICWPEQLLLPFAACRACPLALARWATSCARGTPSRSAWQAAPGCRWLGTKGSPAIRCGMRAVSRTC